MKTLLTVAAFSAASLFTIKTSAQNIFPANGRAGIYTTTPVASLQVSGGARFGRPSQYLDIDSATGNLSFGGNASLRVGGNRYAFQYSGNPSTGLYFNANDARFEFRNNAATPVFYINAGTGSGTFTGNVGIAGVTDAGYALNVNSSASYGGIKMTDPVDNMLFSGTKSGGGTALFISKTNTTSNTATLYSNNSGTGPAVYGQSTNGLGVQGYSVEGNGVYGNSYNAYGVYAYSSNYRALYADGNDSYYTAYINGDIYANGNYLGSDAKLKKDIRDVNNAMDIIKQLKPKHYEFRNDGNYAKMKLPKGNHYGLIAQDVEKILPQLVKSATFNTRDAKPRNLSADANEEAGKPAATDDNEAIDFKAVNYTELIPILVKALQEQDAKIETLTKELHQVKASQPAITAVDASSAIDVLNINSIKAVPNPARSSVTITALNKSGIINVTDIQGRKLLQMPVTAEIMTLNTSTLTTGMYIIQYLDKGKMQSIKFIKE